MPSFASLFLQECPPTPVVTNAHTISSNIALGGETTYECDDDFGLQGTNTKITCSGTGQYTAIQFACYRKFVFTKSQC